MSDLVENPASLTRSDSVDPKDSVITRITFISDIEPVLWTRSLQSWFLSPVHPVAGNKVHSFHVLGR